jgi:hypothetical protein
VGKLGHSVSENREGFGLLLVCGGL